MGVILESERRGWKARGFLFLIYALLTLGALTMVYPFAVMLTASCSSSYDYARHSPVLDALFDRSDRFMRSIALRFRVFPRALYPEAPENWTSWESVAKERGAVRNFATKELAKYATPEAQEKAREQAKELQELLLSTDPADTSCYYDPRDVARFVQAKYGTLEQLNAAWPIPHKSFFTISFSAESKVLPGTKRPNDPKFTTWLELKRSYLTRAAECGDWVSRTLPADLSDPKVAEAVRAALAVQFLDHGWRDFFEGAFANYRLVSGYLFLRGRAFVNTIILVVLSILASLTVNPLAAYALSRFRLRGTEKILLFLLATMAFPAAVTAIPGFLLIRDLGLLNTFAALVLPTVANGMGIFVLKGFFDALPRELYEAAAIDGAREGTVFLKITLPLTAPILAVNALYAFIHAYASWEWAFLVCQKESHWTLAVWMYQLSQTFAHQPWCVMAGFVVVSIPTAFVFLVCQKVILRGIVLPSMK